MLGGRCAHDRSEAAAKKTKLPRAHGFAPGPRGVACLPRRRDNSLAGALRLSQTLRHSAESVNGGNELKICFYTSTALPKRGGQETVVDSLAREFLRLQHRITVLAPMPRRPLSVDDSGLPYRVVRHPRFYSTRRLVPWYRWFLLRLFREEGFDLLHCHGVYPPGYLAVLCRERLQIPIVITSHEGGLSNGNVRLAKPLLRRHYVAALSGADALVAVSRMVEDDYRRLCADARLIRWIPNGVSVAAWDGLAQRPACLDSNIEPGEFFLYLGRLTRRKGADWLLHAFARVVVAERKKLVIAGEGEDGAALMALTRQLHLQDRVCFVGWADGATKSYLLQNALCTVVPSRRPEAFGLVVLESYAAGRPVVASRVPGLEELVAERESGLLVPPDSVEALARALQELAANRDRADAMGRQGRAWVQRYSWRAVAERHVELYASLVASHGASAAARR